MRGAGSLACPCSCCARGRRGSGVKGRLKGRSRQRCAAPLRPEGRPRTLRHTLRARDTTAGGERAGWGWCTGAGSWLSPLPCSYSRVEFAGRLFAGRGPTLTTSVGWLKTFTGIIPAAACVPVHHRSKAGRWRRPKGVAVSWSSPPTRSRPAPGRGPPPPPPVACRVRSSSCTWRAAAAEPSTTWRGSPHMRWPDGARV